MKYRQGEGENQPYPCFDSLSLNRSWAIVSSEGYHPLYNT